MTGQPSESACTQEPASAPPVEAPLQAAAPAVPARFQSAKQSLLPSKRPAARDRQMPSAGLDKKRSWKARFFRTLTSAPALFVFATILAPSTLIGSRETIVRHIPASAGIYAMAGLKVNLDGLDLRNVTSVIREQGKARHLLVKGEIVNLRSRDGVLPNLSLSLRGNNGRDIYTWQAPSPQKRITGHSSIRFLARLEEPPGKASDVVVRFAGRNN